MGTFKNRNRVEKPIKTDLYRDFAKSQELSTIPQLTPVLALPMPPTYAGGTKVDFYLDASQTSLAPIYGVPQGKRLIIHHISMNITSGITAGFSGLRVYDLTASTFISLINEYLPVSSGKNLMLQSPMPIVLEPTSIIYVNPSATHGIASIYIQGYLVDI